MDPFVYAPLLVLYRDCIHVLVLDLIFFTRLIVVYPAEDEGNRQDFIDNNHVFFSRNTLCITPPLHVARQI